MSKSTSTLQGHFSLNTLQVMRDLWQQMAAVADNARLLTEADLVEVISDLPKFSLLRSSKFNALLVGKTSDINSPQEISIEITFDPAVINNFIANLPPLDIASISPKSSNDPRLQTQFTQLLFTALTTNFSSTTEVRWQREVIEANLLNDIATQIHRTLDLSVILQSVLEQVQNFLHADRLLIFQFKFDTLPGKITTKNLENYLHRGQVAYEALVSAEIPSVLNLTEEDICFAETDLWDRYQTGKSKAIDNVESYYQVHPCLLDFLRRHQVKSKLVVPIVVHSGLWGLLIAHQCKYIRQWQTREIEFLEKVAQHLAFAIYHAEILIASQHQTKTLEQLVNARTQELKDAMIVAQTANQSKTEFLALLSHELRTPLTSILGLSATLLRLPDTNLTERQRTYLQTIHNSGDHLSELIDDILDFYKLEVGKTFLRVSEFSISKLVKQIFEIVRAKAEAAKIDFHLQILNNGEDVTHLGGRDLRFRGDTKRIRQILINLLINAIKFTPENGTVILRTWLEDRYAVFEVEDTGIGIAPEQIPRVFRKFQQLNSNYDRDYAGMGLGLAISQQLVELHGGWIDVESTPGSGSTFTVWLASQALKLPEDRSWDELDRELLLQDANLDAPPRRVILVEQDEALADFICDILTAGQYQVTWLLSAESAFRQISVFQPDLVIIDLAIGNDIADAIVNNIRQSSAICDTKIIAIANKKERLSPVVKQCVDDYIWKKVNPEQLLKKIRKLLSEQIQHLADL
jgi:two-component system sensor histidine kinase/response regulator